MHAALTTFKRITDIMIGMHNKQFGQRTQGEEQRGLFLFLNPIIFHDKSNSRFSYRVSIVNNFNESP